MDLFDEFAAVIETLDDAGLEYAVVGALAVAVYGAPRATTDIDLLVRPDQVDAVLAAVNPLGFKFLAQPITFSDGMQLRRATKIEAAESLTLDLLLVDANLQPIWASRSTIATDFGDLSVISRDALIQMKTLAGRTRDIADIERLRENDR